MKQTLWPALVMISTIVLIGCRQSLLATASSEVDARQHITALVTNGIPRVEAIHRLRKLGFICSTKRQEIITNVTADGRRSKSEPMDFVIAEGTSRDHSWLIMLTLDRNDTVTEVGISTTPLVITIAEPQAAPYGSPAAGSPSGQP